MLRNFNYKQIATILNSALTFSYSTPPTFTDRFNAEEYDLYFVNALSKSEKSLAKKVIQAIYTYLQNEEKINKHFDQMDEMRQRNFADLSYTDVVKIKKMMNFNTKKAQKENKKLADTINNVLENFVVNNADLKAREIHLTIKPLTKQQTEMLNSLNTDIGLEK